MTFGFIASVFLSIFAISHLAIMGKKMVRATTNNKMWWCC